MPEWWWQAVADYYTRLADAPHRDPSQPSPADLSQGMRAAVAMLRAHPGLCDLRPGLEGGALTLCPARASRCIRLRWVMTGLYEIELEDGGDLLALPWDGRILVPEDVLPEALLNCRRLIERSAA